MTDLSTFAKVRALHDSTTSPGEKAAAATRMRTLARKAGLTVAQAKAKLDAPPVEVAAYRTVDLGDAFSALFNTPEMRAQRAERERRYAERRAAVLAEFGSEEAVWNPCERERALIEACRPFITRVPIIGGEMDTLMGWHMARLPELPAPARKAVETAFPAPATVREAWAEFQHWEKVADDRIAFFEHYDHSIQVRTRTYCVEYWLDTLPAKSMGDLQARLDWMQHLNDRGWDRGNPEASVLLATLRADVECLGERLRTQGGAS